MAKLNVDIVTPERRVAQLQADELIAPGADGLFGVRPGHTPYLALLQPGPLTVRDGASTTVYFVGGGFVEAGPNAVRVLADTAELQKEIDLAGAEKRLADAQNKLKALTGVDPAIAQAQAVVLREQRRVEVAKRS